MHRDPAVAARGRPAAPLPRRHARHDGARRTRDRPRRSRGRRDHRCGEHRPAPAAEPRTARAAAPRWKSCSTRRWKSGAPCVYGSLIVVAGVPAGVHARRTDRIVLPAARTRVRAGHHRVAAGGAHDHAGAGAAAAAEGQATRAEAGASRARLKAALPPNAAERSSDGRWLPLVCSPDCWRSPPQDSVSRRGIPSGLPRVRLPDALGGEAWRLGRGDARASPNRPARNCWPSPAYGTSDRTSGAPKSQTKSLGRTSPSCGSASTPRSSTSATVAKVQSVVDGYPGLQRDLLTYLRERIKEVLTGASATIVVRIFGPDLDDAAREGARVRGALADVDGVADLQVQSAGARSADRRALRSGSRRAAWPDACRRAPRRDHARAGHQGRRVLRKPACLRRGRVAEPEGMRAQS